MGRPATAPNRRQVGLDDELWERVTNYRFDPLLSGSLSPDFRKVAATSGFSTIRCWGGFDPATALPDDTAGG